MAGELVIDYVDISVLVFDAVGQVQVVVAEHHLVRKYLLDSVFHIPAQHSFNQVVGRDLFDLLHLFVEHPTQFYDILEFPFWDLDWEVLENTKLAHYFAQLLRGNPFVCQRLSFDELLNSTFAVVV